MLRRNIYRDCYIAFGEEDEQKDIEFSAIAPFHATAYLTVDQIRGTELVRIGEDFFSINSTGNFSLQNFPVTLEVDLSNLEIENNATLLCTLGAEVVSTFPRYNALSNGTWKNRTIEIFAHDRSIVAVENEENSAGNFSYYLNEARAVLNSPWNDIPNSPENWNPIVLMVLNGQQVNECTGNCKDMNVTSGAEWVLGELEFYGYSFQLWDVTFSNIKEGYTKIVPQNETKVSISVGVDYVYRVRDVLTAPPVILTLKLGGDLQGYCARAFAFPRINCTTPLRVMIDAKIPKNVSYKEYHFSATVRANLHAFEEGYCLKLKRNNSAPPLLSVTPVPIEWTWKGNVACYIDNQTTPINSSDIIAIGNGKLKFNIKKLIDPDYWNDKEEKAIVYTYAAQSENETISLCCE